MQSNHELSKLADGQSLIIDLEGHVVEAEPAVQFTSMAELMSGAKWNSALRKIDQFFARSFSQSSTAFGQVTDFEIESNESTFQCILTAINAGQIVVHFRDVTHTTTAANQNTYLQESLKVGIWTFNRKSGEITLSDGGQNIIDRPRGLLLTKDSILSYLMPEDHESFKTAFEARLKSESPLDLKLRMLSGQGRMKWVHMHSPLNSDFYAQGILSGTIQDVSEQVVNDQKTSFVMNSANVATWEWDLINDKISTSANWWTRLGYYTETLDMGISEWEECIHSEDLEHVKSSLQKAISDPEGRFSISYRLVNKDQQVLWVRDVGTVIERDERNLPIRVVGVQYDVTNEESRAQSLEQSQQQLNEMITSLPSSVAMFDRDLRYISHSDQWLEDFQIAATDLAGKSIYDTDPMISKVWKRSMQVALAGDSVSHDMEARDLGEGNVRYLSWEMRPWYTIDHAIGGILIMAQDTTHQVQRQLQTAQSMKMNSLGEMAGGVAHEINNPLAIIKGLTYQLRRRAEAHADSEKYGDTIAKIESTADRISTIIKGLRSFSQESSIEEMWPHTVQEIIDGATALTREKFAQHGVNFQIDITQPDSKISCRLNELHQVIMNLLSNAFDAVAEKETKFVELQVVESGQNIVFVVADNGPGIEEEFHSKVFEPFFTRKQVGEGAGLGLSISKGIIDQHGGSIHFSSRPGRTEFYVELTNAAFLGSQKKKQSA